MIEICKPVFVDLLCIWHSYFCTNLCLKVKSLVIKCKIMKPMIELLKPMLEKHKSVMVIFKHRFENKLVFVIYKHMFVYLLCSWQP